LSIRAGTTITLNSFLTEPDADAAIHPILAEILEGAHLLKNGIEKDGHERIHKALLKYGDNFEHSGWNHNHTE
jgi:hypothetical protein